MTTKLPQKYQQVAKAIIPYVPEQPHQMALITVSPALPCFICNKPATMALTAPAPKQMTRIGTAWLTFPICTDCEERQVYGKPEDE